MSHSTTAILHAAFEQRFEQESFSRWLCGCPIHGLVLLARNNGPVETGRDKPGTARIPLPKATEQEQASAITNRGSEYGSADRQGWSGRNTEPTSTTPHHQGAIMAQAITLSEFGWVTVCSAMSADMTEAALKGRWATAAATAEQLASIHRQRGNDEAAEHCSKLVVSYRHLSDMDRKARKGHQS